MHTFDELDLWNRRHAKLVREAEDARQMRALLRARRAKENPGEPAKRVVPMRRRLWPTRHRAA
jgi:hypothetical protein